MKTIRYFDLTADQKVALTNDEFLASVKIEGIHRGIKPPIPIEENLRKSEWQGFTIPPESMRVYELVGASQYGTPEPSGITYLDPEKARKALDGAFSIYSDGYGNTAKAKITNQAMTVRETYIPLVAQKQYAVSITEFFEDDKEFNALCEECRADRQTILQARYDAKVLQCKRAEYLSLAGGNEEIARAFWAKTEREPFPEVPKEPVVAVTEPVPTPTGGDK